MTIISKRSPNTLEWVNNAVEYAPNAWAHRRTMLAFSKMNFLDQETFKKMHGMFGGRGWQWIASWDLGRAGAINALHPEVFNDTSGKAMLRFLDTEEGREFDMRTRK